MKMIIFSSMLVAAVFIGAFLATSVLADSYGYGAYGGVNSVVMPMMYQAATKDNTPEPKPVAVDPDAPLAFRTFNSGSEFEVIRKFVDPDNGNVCYIWSVNQYSGLGGISCVK